MGVSHLSPSCILICVGGGTQPDVFLLNAHKWQSKLGADVQRSLSALMIMLLHYLHDTACMITFITSPFDCVNPPPPPPPVSPGSFMLVS